MSDDATHKHCHDTASLAACSVADDCSSSAAIVVDQRDEMVVHVDVMALQDAEVAVVM